MVKSGAQTGSDQAGLFAAEKYGIMTGGWMPKDFRTLNGNRPDLAKRFNLKEHKDWSYSPRTELNVLECDVTIRFAGDFSSAGERCTLKFLKKYNKPYLDIDITDLPHINTTIEWLNDYKPKIVNIAGNSEKTCPGIYQFTYDYLCKLFEKLNEHPT